jgi:small-conductance mechanosensitive channel
MWNWYLEHSVWFLIIAAILMLLLPFLNNRTRGLITGLISETGREKVSGGINKAFWVIEIIIAIILLVSFISMMIVHEGAAPLVSTEHIKAWILEHGVKIVIILVVGFVLLAALKKFLPTLVSRFMARPIRGESQQGIKKRANTLLGVFLGLGRVIIILLILLMVLSEVGVAIGPVLAGFGVVGIAVGFGAQFLIRDLIAGIFILMENQYRVGDVASVGGVTGLVEEINLRKTVLRDLDGIVHHVPNGEIRVASNYTRHYSRVNLNISVAYGTDLDFAIEVINKVGKEMAGEERWSKVLKSVPQVLRVDSLGDSGIDIKILGDVVPLEQWNVMGELRLRLKKAFDKEGIEIPWPHTKVYFGNKPGD